MESDPPGVRHKTVGSRTAWCLAAESFPLGNSCYISGHLELMRLVVREIPSGGVCSVRNFLGAWRLVVCVPPGGLGAGSAWHSPYLLVFGDDRVCGTCEQMMLLQVVLVRLSAEAGIAWE
ncbi:hypothetical protein DEO72_LG1g2874 [Vigna unguiculata]|uniref:Uncharacterized protein n=1 Tax=Vigna unguiculata TaxID=3917 RepID=A0A4D6KRS1_VIGUN|nr:hypothetical protein DEO72_LG1g2874 [Vigna unguiculata]